MSNLGKRFQLYQGLQTARRAKENLVKTFPFQVSEEQKSRIERLEMEMKNLKEHIDNLK